MTSYKFFTIKPNVLIVSDLRGPAESNAIYQYYTIFEVYDGPPLARGLYLYNGPWSSGMNLVQGQLTDLSVNYANQPWTATDNPTQNPPYPEGTYVPGFIEGGSNLGFGLGNTGGGVIRDGSNLTLLGGGLDTNLTYPRTGSRLIRATTIEGEERLIQLWRANCKYSREGVSPIPGAPNGIFIPANADTTDETLIASEVIPQSQIDQFRYQVRL